MSDPGPTPEPTADGTSKKRQIIASAVTLVTLVIVFAVIMPQFADYGEAWDAVQAMSTGTILWLVLVTIATVVAYVWPYQAALPGLSYGPAFVVRQTSFAISNGIPGGGALGLGVQYEMLSDYGFETGPATSAIGITSVWNTLVTLGMPVLAVLALALTGDFEAEVLGAAAVGVVAVGSMVGLLVLIFKSETAARRLGEFGDRLVRRIGRLFGRDVDLDLVGKLLDFRASTVEVVRRHAMAITATNVLQQLMQFAVLYFALRGITSGATAEPTFAEVLVAYSVGRLGSFIPVTPGGLGTVDAAITAILVAFGAHEPDALAAVMVWRAATFFPQIFIGIGTFLYWRRRKRQRLATP